jgi:hypothetical protein
MHHLLCTMCAQRHLFSAFLSFGVSDRERPIEEILHESGDQFPLFRVLRDVMLRMRY